MLYSGAKGTMTPNRLLECTRGSALGRRVLGSSSRYRHHDPKACNNQTRDHHVCHCKSGCYKTPRDASEKDRQAKYV